MSHSSNFAELISTKRSPVYSGEFGSGVILALSSTRRVNVHDRIEADWRPATRLLKRDFVPSLWRRMCDDNIFLFGLEKCLWRQTYCFLVPGLLLPKPLRPLACSSHLIVRYFINRK